MTRFETIAHKEFSDLLIQAKGLNIQALEKLEDWIDSYDLPTYGSDDVPTIIESNFTVIVKARAMMLESIYQSFS